MDPLRKRTLTYMLSVWVLFAAIALTWIFILDGENITYFVLMIVFATMATSILSMRLGKADN